MGFQPGNHVVKHPTGSVVLVESREPRVIVTRRTSVDEVESLERIEIRVRLDEFVGVAGLGFFVHADDPETGARISARRSPGFTKEVEANLIHG